MDEGRVQMTAAAFTKGLLELQGELAPILVSLIDHEKSVHQVRERALLGKRARRACTRVSV